MIEFDDLGNVKQITIPVDADWDDALWLQTAAARPFNEDGGGLAAVVLQFTVLPTYAHPDEIANITSAPETGPRIIKDDVALAGISFAVTAAELAAWGDDAIGTWVCILRAIVGGSSIEEIFRCPFTLQAGAVP